MQQVKFSRIAARVALVLAFVIAAGMPVVAFYFRGPESPETWTISAAALAVITSIIAAWSSRRVVELQEDAQRPYIYPEFDFKSRFGVVMLRIRNTGGTAAHNISLLWETQLLDHKGVNVGFVKEKGVSAIAALQPDESISKIIGSPVEFLKNHPKTEYIGSILFDDLAGRQYKLPFRLDARSYRNTPSYDDEQVKTLYELQKVPKEIEKLHRVIDSFAKGQK